MWKERLGTKATFLNLIGVFERAGYQNCADFVKRVCYGKYCELEMMHGNDSIIIPGSLFPNFQVCTQKSKSCKEGLCSITLHFTHNGKEHKALESSEPISCESLVAIFKSLY